MKQTNRKFLKYLIFSAFLCGYTATSNTDEAYAVTKSVAISCKAGDGEWYDKILACKNRDNIETWCRIRGGRYDECAPPGPENEDEEAATVCTPSCYFK